MTIAIDKSYMNKMPNSCKECPLTYLDTGDDAYFGANERRCIIDDSCIDGMVSERACDCPLVDAIPKDQYEARLKADMADMLEDLRLDIKELPNNRLLIDGLYEGGYRFGLKEVNDLIQERIDALRGEENEQTN